MTEITTQLLTGRAVRFAVPVSLMAVTFYLSAQPFDGEQLAWWEVALRKIGHFGGYALLGWSWFWALAPHLRHPVPLGAGLAFLYACTDEYHQTFVDGRTGTVRDVGIDTIGIAAAAIAWIALVRPGRPGPSMARTQGGRRSERTHDVRERAGRPRTKPGAGTGRPG